MIRIVLTVLVVCTLGCDTKTKTRSPAAHVQRGKEKISHQNEMSQIALFYINYATQTNTPPKTYEELKKFMGGDGMRLAQLIESGEVIVRYNVKPSTQEILVYERDTDLNGNHVVVKADRSVHTVPAAELQKELQGHP